MRSAKWIDGRRGGVFFLSSCCAAVAVKFQSANETPCTQWTFSSPHAACRESLLPVGTGARSDDVLSLEQLSRGAVNIQGSFRFRAILHKLESKSPIRIAVLGGSVEEGYPIYGSRLWHTVFVDWLKKYYQYSDIDATVFSLEGKHVLRGVDDWDNDNETIATQVLESGTFDLVMMQGAVNFPFHSEHATPTGFAKDIITRRKYEELALREILAAVNGPALLLVEWMNTCKLEVETLEQFQSTNCMIFSYGTWQDESTTVLAKMYEVSMVSARDALLHSVMLRSGQGSALGMRFSEKEVFADGLHPSVLGHQLFGQIVSFFFCEQLASQRHFAKCQKSAPAHVHRQLPPPFFDNAATQMAVLTAHSAAVAPINSTDMLVGSIMKLPAPANTLNNTGFLSAVRAASLPLLMFEALAFLPRCPDQDDSARNSDANSQNPFRLEVFRVLGIVHIVLYHHGMVRPLEGSWGNFCAAGRYQVQFFFALSGYIEFTRQRGQAKVLHFQDLLVHRLARAYPLYLIGTVLGLLASSEPLDAATSAYLKASAAPPFLMMDSWLCPYGQQSPNGPGWFLCTIFAFWLCFPRWYNIVRHSEYPITLCGCAWLSSCALPWALTSMTDFGEFHPLANWPSYVFGMCVARLAQMPFGASGFLVLSRVGACGAFVLLVVLFIALPPDISAGWSLWLDKGPILLPLFGLVLFLVPFGDDILFGHDCWTSPAVLWLGRLSFSLFALHWPVYMMLQKWCNGLSMSLELLAQCGAAMAYGLIEGVIRCPTSQP